MTDLRAFLYKLEQNLNILKEREAKYGGNAPLTLLNEIRDHNTAIELTEQALSGEEEPQLLKGWQNKNNTDRTRLLSLVKDNHFEKALAAAIEIEEVSDQAAALVELLH